MPGHQHTDLSTFFIAGINYKKSDAISRGQYAINTDQYTTLLSLAPKFGIKELFVLSTCNRTEIYGFADDVLSLCSLLCTQTQGSLDNFIEMSYVKNGKKAIEHLFDVAAGIDSQILGDYEIIGQIKQSVKFSKQHGFVGAYIERLVNEVLQSSKMIKNTTLLSGGTVSVSFAAIQYIKENVTHINDAKILLLGTGKIGRNTCKNLIDYLGTKNITLINRTENKAAELAAQLGIGFAPMSDLAKEVASSNIIIVATNSPEPVIFTSHLIDKGNKIIIDLSIPYNVEIEASKLSNITLVNVDELSKIKDNTLQKRVAEVPKAKLIIDKHVSDFLSWHQMRRNVPVLKAVKNKLEQMNSCSFFINNFSSEINKISILDREQKIQKVISGMALKMRSNNHSGCYYIEAINEYLSSGSVSNISTDFASVAN